MTCDDARWLHLVVEQLCIALASFHRVGNAPRVERHSRLFPINARGVAHAVDSQLKHPAGDKPGRVVFQQAVKRGQLRNLIMLSDYEQQRDRHYTLRTVSIGRLGEVATTLRSVPPFLVVSVEGGRFETARRSAHCGHKHSGNYRRSVPRLNPRDASWPTHNWLKLSNTPRTNS